MISSKVVSCLRLESTLCECKAMSLAEKHVLLIAGPSACGKSTMISRMLSDCCMAKEILSKVDLEYSRNLGKLNLQRLVNHNRLSKKSRKNKVKIALTQFDILSRHSNARALELENVANSAQSIRFLVLYLPFNEWLYRMNQRCNYCTGSNHSALAVCAGFLCAGSKGSRPSRKAWSIVMASRFSMALAKKMYKAEYLRWHNYWVRYSDVPLFYFDSCLGSISTSLICYD